MIVLNKFKFKDLVNWAAKPRIKVIWRWEYKNEKARYDYCCDYVVCRERIGKWSSPKCPNLIRLTDLPFKSRIIGHRI